MRRKVGKRTNNRLQREGEEQSSSSKRVISQWLQEAGVPEIGLDATFIYAHANAAKNHPYGAARRL